MSDQLSKTGDEEDMMRLTNERFTPFHGPPSAPDEFRPDEFRLLCRKLAEMDALWRAGLQKPSEEQPTVAPRSVNVFVKDADGLSKGQGLESKDHVRVTAAS